MKIETKYSIGDVILWKVNGIALIVTAIKVLNESYAEYMCSFSDSDGQPKESTFTECELEPWTNGFMGFGGKK